MPQLQAEDLANWQNALGTHWRLTDYRQIELYTKRKKLVFAEPAAASGLPPLLGCRTAYHLLADALAAADPELLEGRSSWEKYQALPRATTTDKLVAEVFRILRILHIALSHAGGRVEMRDGLLRAACNFKRCALALNITPGGLQLLESFVFRYLDHRQPYGEAYVEALLTQYFTDLVLEIHKFADEDRVLYQFRPRLAWFNRHFRYDCDNPRVQMDDGHYRFAIGANYADPVRFPIDFFVPLDDALYIVPVEALSADGRLPRSELPRWRARTAGAELPAEFRQRFGREVMIVGLPMT